MYGAWNTIECLDGGFSQDEKFLATMPDGRQCLLIISDGAVADNKYREFSVLKALKELEPTLQIPSPLESGSCDDGFYQMLSWMPGKTLDTVDPSVKYYEWGYAAGQLLRQLHQISSKLEAKKYFSEFNLQKILNRKLHHYVSSGLNLPCDEDIIDFLLAGSERYENDPAIILHGDFHLKNLVLSPEGVVSLIDFNRMKPGPCCMDFARMEIYSRPVSPDFCQAVYDGYANGKVSVEFMEAVRYFTVFEVFFNVQWQTPYGRKAVEEATTLLKRIWKNTKLS